MIGGGERTISGITGRHLLAEMVPRGHTSPYWTQKERDVFVICGRRPAQSSLFDAVAEDPPAISCRTSHDGYIPEEPTGGAARGA
jgi:hypothetical protein